MFWFAICNTKLLNFSGGVSVETWSEGQHKGKIKFPMNLLSPDEFLDNLAMIPNHLTSFCYLIMNAPNQQVIPKSAKTTLQTKPFEI